MDIKEQILLSKKYIKKLENIIKSEREKIKINQSKCSHADIEVSQYGSAKCNICDEEFHWYCPTSPTLECDYEQEDGSYDEDCCRYCGLPEERK